MKQTLKSWYYLLRRLAIPWRSRMQTVVLAYHSISSDQNDPYAVSPQEFSWQLEELLREGFAVVRVTELEDMLRTNSIRPRTAVITLDDGRKDNKDQALPILERLGLHATIFSTTGAIGKRFPASHGEVDALSEDDMCRMQASDFIDFEPHSVTHPKLTAIALDEARREIEDSKRKLEEMLGKPCPYFAYPKGRWSPEIADIARRAGIRLAFAMGGGVVTAGSNPLSLPRNDITARTTRTMFKGIIAHGARG